MKKYILKYACIALLPALSINNSCNDNEIVVDRFDDSYTPEKPTKGERNTPPPVNLLDTYAFFTETSSNQSIKKKVKKNGVEIQGLENISFDIFLNKEAEKELPYSLEIDNEWLSSKGLKALPSDAYELNYNNKFELNQKQNKITINFKEEIFKTLEKGLYTLPLKPVFEDSEVKHLAGNDKFMLEVNLLIQRLPDGNNIDNSDTKTEIEGTYSNSEITFSSPNNTNNLDKLNDGDAVWYTNSGNDILIAKIPEPDEIIGIKLLTYYSSNYDSYRRYSLKQVKIESANGDDDEYVEQGVFIDSDYDQEDLYIKFSEPIEVDRIRFSDFLSHTGTREVVTIVGVEFIYAN